MKKLLAIMAGGLLTISPGMALISCNKSNDWNNIPVDPPVLPIKIIGFAGINFKTIKPQDSRQTIPQLLTDLAQLFEGTRWNFGQLVKNYKFNNQVQPINKIDLYRNGQYELNFNDGTNLNTIRINKSVITSNHLADKVKSIDLGKITDVRPKTILIAVIFNNMKLISELDKFGEFFIGEQIPEIWNKQISDVVKIKINPDQTGATLMSGKEHWSENDDPRKDYYGSVKVWFSVNPGIPPTTRDDLGKMNLTKNLGRLPRVTILQVMMIFISVNFVSQINDRLSALLNDLYIDINPNKTIGIIRAYDKSKYYLGEVTVTFS